MDVSNVSQAISINNKLVMEAVTAQTEMGDALNQISLQAKVQEQQAPVGGDEAGKGLLIDTLA